VQLVNAIKPVSPFAKICNRNFDEFDLPSRKPIETAVDLYDRTTLRLADGIDRNDETASMVQRTMMKTACLNIL
jgi:hypothetical protein